MAPFHSTAAVRPTGEASVTHTGWALGSQQLLEPMPGGCRPAPPAPPSQFLNRYPGAGLPAVGAVQTPSQVSQRKGLQACTGHRRGDQALPPPPHPTHPQPSLRCPHPKGQPETRSLLLEKYWVLLLFHLLWVSNIQRPNSYFLHTIHIHFPSLTESQTSNPKSMRSTFGMATRRCNSHGYPEDLGIKTNHISERNNFSWLKKKSKTTCTKDINLILL